MKSGFLIRNLYIDYYNTHANDFSDDTKDIEFTSIQDRFLSLLTPGACVLDFGCGSGRDTKYFLDKGCTVDAIDGSEELCRLASGHTGITVQHMYFQDLSVQDKYDGIWACSSILHLEINELIDVMRKMTAAVKPGGIIYTSFKYGTFSGIRNGRYFTDMTESMANDLIKEIKLLHIEDQWITTDARPGRSDTRWLNMILRRSEPL